jgi:hypothetical protein
MHTISVLLKWWRNYIGMQHTFIVSPAEVSRMQAMMGLNPDRGWCWPPISTRRLKMVYRWNWGTWCPWWWWPDSFVRTKASMA